MATMYKCAYCGELYATPAERAACELECAREEEVIDEIIAQHRKEEIQYEIDLICDVAQDFAELVTQANEKYNLGIELTLEVSIPDPTCDDCDNDEAII